MTDNEEYTLLPPSYEYLMKVPENPDNPCHSIASCVRETRWVKNSKGIPMLHSTDGGPSVLYWSKDGDELIRAEWYLNGRLGREGGKPAAQEEELAPGVYLREEFWKGGYLQTQENGDPAVIVRDYDGFISTVQYHSSSLFDRKNGPAIINYYQDGSVSSEDYFKEGQEINPPMVYPDLSL